MRGSEDIVRKLRRSSLSGDAYTFVHDLFTNGTRYNPGEKISVEELSRELGVSRTPLWGAINRLEAEGIVEIVPRQGVYLINYDPDRALEIYEAREALEGMAARLAAEKISDRQAAALQANIDEQREQLTKGDIEGYHAKALEFHEQIVRIRAKPHPRTPADFDPRPNPGHARPTQLHADAPAAILRRSREAAQGAAQGRS